MVRLEWGLTFEGTKRMRVAFMTLLRHTLPELYTHLEAVRPTTRMRILGSSVKSAYTLPAHTYL